MKNNKILFWLRKCRSPEAHLFAKVVGVKRFNATAKCCSICNHKINFIRAVGIIFNWCIYKSIFYPFIGTPISHWMQSTCEAENECEARECEVSGWRPRKSKYDRNLFPIQTWHFVCLHSKYVMKLNQQPTAQSGPHCVHFSYSAWNEFTEIMNRLQFLLWFFEIHSLQLKSR